MGCVPSREEVCCAPITENTILADGVTVNLRRIAGTRPKRGYITPFLAKGICDAVQVGIRACANTWHTPQRDCAGFSPDFPQTLRHPQGPCAVFSCAFQYGASRSVMSSMRCVIIYLTQS